MNLRSRLSLIVGFSFSIFVMIYSYLTIDWVVLKSLITNLNWHYFVLCVSAYFANIALRALRYKYIVNSRFVHWVEFIIISIYHNFFVYLLPAKIGELSYIALAKKRLNISIPDSAATLIAVRFYDITSIIILLFTILLFARHNVPPGILTSTKLFVGISSIFIFIVIALLYTKKLHIHTNMFSNQLSRKLLTSWNKFVTALYKIQKNKLHLRLLGLTFGIWTCIYINFYFNVRSLGFDLSIMEIVIISLVMVPLNSLPFQGFANIGTHELGWVSVLILFGHSYNHSLMVAIGTHLLLFITIILAAGIGYIISILLFFINKEPRLT